MSYNSKSCLSIKRPKSVKDTVSERILGSSSQLKFIGQGQMSFQQKYSQKEIKQYESLAVKLGLMPRKIKITSQNNHPLNKQKNLNNPKIFNIKTLKLRKQNNNKPNQICRTEMNTNQKPNPKLNRYHFSQNIQQAKKGYQKYLNSRLNLRNQENIVKNFQIQKTERHIQNFQVSLNRLKNKY